MNDLSHFFETYNLDKGKATYKHFHYANIYNDFFYKYRGTDVSIVELGVGHGGCLQMWKSYFGEQANVYGLDKEDGLLFEESQIRCFVIDQSKKEDLQKICSLIPKIDIFIDDGSHINSHQINTFETVFPSLSDGGLYIVEDTHTSYREKDFQGGYKKEGTFIEYCKNIIDSFYYTETPDIIANNLINSIYFIAFYNAMVVIKKERLI